MNANEARQWLLERKVCTRPHGLARMEFLLEALDRPQELVPSVIIGGTNGKGSVTAMLEAIMRCTGEYETGSLTSPHLRCVTERIRIQGRPMADELWLQGVQLLKKPYRVMERDESLGPASFFELVTALAFWAFRETERDIVFLEVGLGGRLDATNAAAPEISVITNIGTDHQDLLGSDRASIAREKLGILRPKRPLITGERDPLILAQFAEACKKSRSMLIPAHGDDSYTVLESTPMGHRLRLPGIDREVVFGLAGTHQLENLNVVLAVIRQLRENGFDIPPDAVADGLQQVTWPGRLQWIPGHPRILLDGAHNHEGMATLLAYLGTFPPPKPLQIILGVLENKPAQDMARKLAPFADSLAFVPPPIGRAIGREAFSDLIQGTDSRWRWFDTLPEAIAAADPEGTVLITGSLYLVGDFLTRRPQEDPPEDTSPEEECP
jgi:dihydrofolate synthase/folylpolyglutamate synthase